MGGSSKSSSSSNQTTQTQNVSLQDTQGLNVAGIDHATLNITDSGATAKALDLGQTAIDGGVDIVTGLFDFLDKTQNEALGAVSDTAQLATQALSDTRPANDAAASKNFLALGGAAVISWAVVNMYRSKK